MTKYESQIKVIQAPVERVYATLSNLENLRPIIQAAQDNDMLRQQMEQAGMEVVGASSDHLLLDLTRCGGKVGEIVRFRPNYTALLRAFTSEYVEKVYR